MEGEEVEAGVPRGDRWKAWDDFIETNTSVGFRQSSWYTGLKETHDGWDHFETILKFDGAIVGGAVVFERCYAEGKIYYYVPDGPVLLKSDTPSEQEQVFAALLNSIEARRRNETRIVSHLTISPSWEAAPAFLSGFQESTYYYGSPRDTQIIDLTPCENDILAQMKPKGRYNIGVARRSGVSIIEDSTTSGVDEFVGIYQETCARKNLKGRGSRYFHSLISALSPTGRGAIFFAEYAGERIAAAIVVYFAGVATYYYGGSRALHRNVMAPYLLHFEIMRAAKARGCHSYDLFGVSPEGEPVNKWTDISIFKRKFGGREVHFLPPLEHVYDRAEYHAWRAIERERRRLRHRGIDAEEGAGALLSA